MAQQEVTTEKTVTKDPGPSTPLRVGAESAEWHVLDAKNKVLGRLATEAAGLLMGKHRRDVVPHQVAPVYVVVTNTDEVVLTGKKEDQKVYRWHTGRPGGLKERSVREQRARDSRRIVEYAVSGMLPKNKLHKLRLRHLKLYPGADHPHLPQTAGKKVSSPLRGSALMGKSV